jgi:transcriptional regulator with XRE-family HTH domain
MKVDGKLYRRTRIKQGRSLSELARTLGFDKSHLSKVERGLEGLSPPRALLLATELGLEMSQAVPELAESNVS